MKNRPYWFVDAKWISGIVFCLLCAPMLLAAGLTLATSETLSVRMFSVIFKETKIAPKPAEAKALAKAVYNNGSPALVDRMPDEEAKQKIESIKTWINIFTKPSNNWFRTAAIILFLLEIIPFGLLIFFSYRFGRIKSPGYAILFGALPGLGLTIVLQKLIIGSDLSLPIGAESVSAASGQGSAQLILPIAQALSLPFKIFVYLGLALIIISLTLELAVILKKKLQKTSRQAV